MNDTYTITIPIKGISSSYKSHDYLSRFAIEIMESDSKNIVIDMSNVTYIASNQFAVLGCIMDTSMRLGKHTELSIKGLSGNLRDLIRKNGFCQHFDLEKLPDKNNTVIPYRYFGSDEIEDYEKYLLLYLLNRKELPLMTEMVKDTILDYLLEVFKNVIDHTTSERIYTCGQFFPKSSMLYFTMVDAGETIPYNVNKYFKKYGKDSPENALFWAIQEGHTTVDEDGPRGIGLSLIKSFVTSNKGGLYIVSGKNTYERTTKGERCLEMRHSFPGTIVTLAFNLKDTSAYFMMDGTIQEIEF